MLGKLQSWKKKSWALTIVYKVFIVEKNANNHKVMKLNSLRCILSAFLKVSEVSKFLIQLIYLINTLINWINIAQKVINESIHILDNSPNPPFRYPANICNK